MYPFNIQKNKPKGFPSIKKEPVFNPKTDLQLEKPKKIKNLKELGYSNKELKNLSTQFAFSSPTRILSEEGIGKLYEVVKLLEPYAKSSERIPRMVRGGVYQSKLTYQTTGNNINFTTAYNSSSTWTYKL